MLVRESSTKRVVIDAAAKINLFLEVLGRRDDGYHDIYSLFQAVSLFDRLTLEPKPSAGVDITLESGSDLTTGSDNLIARAYGLMARKFGLTGGLSVRLEKRIPIAAGMGGGSADGAATILAANRLFDLGLDGESMASVSAEIGSDLPFFFSSGQAIVRGRGEIVEHVSLPRDYWLVLVTPDLTVSTGEAYAALRRDLTRPGPGPKFTGCRNVEGLLQVLRESGNDFEAVQLETNPILGQIRDGLLDRGALVARMTGSGPTMFGVFGERPKIAGSSFDKRGCWRVFEVQPITWPI